MSEASTANEQSESLGTEEAHGHAPNKYAQSAVSRFLRGLNSKFNFHLPDGSIIGPQSTNVAESQTHIYLRDQTAVSAFLSLNHRRLYEAFAYGHMDIEGSIEDIMRWALGAVTDPHKWSTKLISMFQALGGFIRPTLYREEKLKTHYSFPAEFYAAWLGDDDIPVFSQYFFEEDETALDWKAARDRKLAYMVKVCDLKPGSRLLEIGGGWGGPLRYMSRLGVHVTSITLEQNSFEILQQTIAQENAEHCCAKMADFYTLESEQPFDAIINCGITEHLVDYGALMDQYVKLVKPGGVIYCDFSAKSDPTHEISSVTRKYIYPASDTVNVPRLLHEQGLRSAALELEEIHNDRISYAKTSRAWAISLEQQEDELVSRFGEYAYRMFRYFHWSCVVGFEHNIITAYHLTFRRR